MVQGDAEALEEATDATGAPIGPIVRIHPRKVIELGRVTLHVTSAQQGERRDGGTTWKRASLRWSVEVTLSRRSGGRWP